MASAAASVPGDVQIRRLPPRVAAQIAAGEVIERPASVLKELLENAVDAGAAQVQIEIAGAGRERIAIHDDGRGIPADQVETAFERHATSKLTRADQLYELSSYGFRGEALPAVAAAAGRLTLTTRTPSQSGAVRIEFRDGRMVDCGPAARAVGTSVEVDDLFAPQPARRQFLAGERAERAALTRVAADAILARPDLSLRLTFDGRAALEYQAAPKGGALRDAAAAIFGDQPIERSFDFAAQFGQSDDEPLRLDGLAGSPHDSRRARDGIRLFVNGRPVQDRKLGWAVQDAYRDWLPRGRFPLAVVRLTLPPDAVDVNVHPAKAQVQLRDPDRAFGLLQRALRETLAGTRAEQPIRLLPRRPDLEYAEPQSRRRGGPPLADAAGVPSALLSGQPTQGLLGAHRRRREAGAVQDDSDAPPSESPLQLPPLRMVGQLHRTFILAEGPDGLVLVDQHAAHERVLYDRLLAARARGDAEMARQPLLQPAVLTLDAGEAAVYERAADELAALGFELEPFSSRSLRLRSLPAALPDPSDAEALLRDLLADLGGGERPPEQFDRAAAAAACHGSVRRGAPLDPPAMSALLRDLERTRDPHSCPHGRPTLVEIAAADLLREFRRI